MIEINIDYTTYKLPEANYYGDINDKTQIVVGNTFSTGMNHYNGWLTRHNGGYKKTAAYTISKDGSIYQHFDPKYYSDFLITKSYSECIIPVVLENQGWLINNEGILETWVGNEYDNVDSVVKSSWRTHEYWDAYTNEQMTSLVELSKYLTDIFKIPLQTIGYNTKVNDIYDYRGIVFRSNYQKHSTDLSPAWDYELFKNKLKDNEPHR